MQVDHILPDAEFGHLYIRTNVRAVRYTFRPAKDGTPECGVLITVPARYDLDDVKRSVETMRPRLRQMLVHSSSPQGEAGRGLHIDWDFRILSDCLHITVVKGTKDGFYLHHEPATTCRNAQHHEEVVRPAVMQLICPPDCDFDAEGRQQWLEKVMVEGIRQHAKQQLIPRMVAYARLHNITLREVKINNSHGHWGSCAHHTKRTCTNAGPVGAKAGKHADPTEYFNINLSLFTLLLPLPVQRLILLHELCHTRHMDHSPAFHHDLDIWLDGQEQALEQQLSHYTTSIFSFLTPKS